MKKIMIIAASALFAMSACCQKKEAHIAVFNPLTFERTYETVDIPWAKVVELLPEATVDNVVVCEHGGAEIPSQVVYNGQTEPQGLIFQATVPAEKSSKYTIRIAPRTEYPAKAFGRYVPERKDDYAWENDMVAFRAYGPGLEGETRTPGIDVWNKRTPELIIDRWYKLGDYHHDHGEGMDCYKVGVTLGGGSIAPIVDEKLVLSGNYTEWDRLENGPIRTAVKLVYAPFDVAGKQVTVEKVITLDAHTRFYRTEATFTGDFDRLPVVAGMPMHEGARTAEAEGAIMLTEPASDSKQPAEDGDISLGIVMPGVTVSMQADGHWLIARDAMPGEPVIYWSGSGWSKNGIADDQTWIDTVERQVQITNTPLQIEYVK